MPVCNGKNRYATFALARDSAIRVLERAPVRRLFVYDCPLCRNWHLTKQMGPQVVGGVTRSKKAGKISVRLYHPLKILRRAGL